MTELHALLKTFISRNGPGVYCFLAVYDGPKVDQIRFRFRPLPLAVMGRCFALVSFWEHTRPPQTPGDTLYGVMGFKLTIDETTESFREALQGFLQQQLDTKTMEKE